MLIFVVNIRPAWTFWNSTLCLRSPLILDWSRNLSHNPMSNMAVNNISYSIYLLSTKIEKGYTTKSIPFFFVQYRISTLSINNCQIRLRSAVKTLWERSDPRAEGVQTKDQRRQEYGSCTCLLWGGLDNSLNIIPSALLVRVQHTWKNLYKSIKGLSIRHIVL